MTEELKKKPEQKQPVPIKPFVAKEALCEKCGARFKDWNLYRKHKIDHNLGKQFNTVHPVTGEVEAKEEKKEEMPQKEAPVMPKKPPEIVKTAEVSKLKHKPIVLKYQFTGECEHCGSPVETIEVVLNNKNICIAYCPSEKKQLLQQQVVPITKQLKRK